MSIGSASVENKTDKMAEETTDEGEEETEPAQTVIPKRDCYQAKRSFFNKLMTRNKGEDKKVEQPETMVSLSLEEEEEDGEERSEKHHQEEIELSKLETAIPVEEHNNKDQKKKKIRKFATFKRKLKYDNVIIPGFHESFIPHGRRSEQEPDKVHEVIKKINTIVFSSVLCVAVLAYFIIIPVLMIVFGIIYISDCPAQQNLPIFLIVGGVTATIKTICDVIFRFHKSPAKEKKRFTIPLLILQIFLFSWFVIGCVWVYEMYPPVYDDKSDPRYCNSTLYLFTFWTINSIFILVAVYICFICLLTSVLLMCLYGKEKVDSET